MLARNERADLDWWRRCPISRRRGYYIAMAAQVIAQSATLTGSIGIYGGSKSPAALKLVPASTRRAWPPRRDQFTRPATTRRS
jgi:hypothetical protein